MVYVSRMSKPAAVSEVVSTNVRRARTELRQWSSTELATRLGRLSGDNWTRAKVTRAETGDRAWRIDDVVLFAAALAVTVDELLQPLDGSGYAYASGATVNLKDVRVRTAADMATVADLDAIARQIAAANEAVDAVRTRITGGIR
ncbi:helix-turn-helix transcriptional regulator [Dietzia sp. SLG510A3-30A2]|nr:helix-turn-helix transcriptional regulator [Dietzia sp. SLG510A3-30A2]